MTIIIILIILLIVSLSINVLLIYKSKKVNDSVILKEILDKASTNTLNYVDSSAIHIIEVLKKHYNIDNCTILIKKQEKLKIIASDVSKNYYSKLEEHCTELLQKNKGRAKIQSSDETYLDYDSAEERAIKYSYFISLGDIGCLFIENHNIYARNNFELEFFKIVIKNIGIILQNCVYQDKMSTLAMKDNLTGMFNRNYMQKHIESLKRNCDSLSIAIMDIDHFKNVNDTYGHDFGDVVLKAVSNYVSSRLDENDQIYRWGGEEFIITFPNQEVDVAKFKLNEIREGLSNVDISDDRTSIKITASFGVTEFKKQHTIDEAIKIVDKALYYSKEHGRNQVSIGI
jgi:two-component system cell cycle response regulator